MPINSELVENYFLPDNTPAWQCPTCKLGRLTGDKSRYNIVFDQKSQKIFDDTAPKRNSWQSNLKGVFSSHLICNNSRCQENVVVAGDMSYEEISRGPEYGFEFTQALVPKYFTPGLILINVNEEVPVNIQAGLKKAFELFWIDPSSCGNKLRTVVEMLMDAQSIPALPSLHQRIMAFSAANYDLGTMLLAIKTIGNHGSHKLDELRKDDIVQVCDIIEHVINELYKPSNAHLIAQSNAILNARGPVR